MWWKVSSEVHRKTQKKTLALARKYGALRLGEDKTARRPAWCGRSTSYGAAKHCQLVRRATGFNAFGQWLCIAVKQCKDADTDVDLCTSVETAWTLLRRSGPWLCPDRIRIAPAVMRFGVYATIPRTTMSPTNPQSLFGVCLLTSCQFLEICSVQHISQSSMYSIQCQ